MNTIKEKEVRPLTGEELDGVTGGRGMNATFQVGDVVIEIYADASMYSCATTNLSTGTSSQSTFLGNYPH